MAESKTLKHEWRKKEKNLYFPKNSPEIVDVSEMKFVSVSGEGNPNSESFSEKIGALYSVCYAIKMNLKIHKNPPKGYTDFAVYPLEGVWDINDKAKDTLSGVIDKNDLVYTIMIRQPDFVSDAFFQEMLLYTQSRKPSKWLDSLKFQNINEGKCIQMTHIGSYESEPKSFNIMEDFAIDKGLSRKSKVHREIYLSDFRKVPAEKLKTVLRFQTG